jgi:glycosyltransferase involved in cell wall biosynthesis
MSEPRTRVMFVIPSLGPGGAERVLVTLLNHLDRGRIDPTLVVLRDDALNLAPELPADLRVIVCGTRRVSRSLATVVRLAWRIRPHVVFSTLSHLNLGLAMVRWAFPPGVRTVGRETSIVSSTLEGYRHVRAWRLAYRAFYRRLDSVICQSRPMLDDLVDSFGVPRQRLVQIGNPIDLQRVRRLAEAGRALELFGAPGPNLVCCGRLSPEKGVDLVLDAFATVACPSATLTIVGGGPDEAALRERAARLGIADRVRWLGVRPDPIAYLAQADALVMGSRFDGFPNVALEAIACGTPVIATPATGGLAEIVAGAQGCVLADEVSAPALARAIEAAIGPSGRSRCAPDAAARYDASRIARRYEAVILGRAEAADA